MGAAPSAETLRTAPFCPMRKGSRRLALLPFTQEFFPSPNSPLFVQLYEAYMDSSVRYYIRREGGALLQDHIPPIAFTIQELYARYVAVSSASYFPSNQALREEVEAGRGYRVRPTPCAVVFLYEGSGPEGCVRVSKQKNMQIRVIGAVGDALCEPSTTPIVLRESDVFRYQIFITKSAGDHNLVRVQLIAAYVYQYQCLELIGLREVPFLPTTMLTLKTNIPFLCFFRELRGRTYDLWGPSTALSMWVDNVCLRVSASADSMRAICDAFAQHFMLIKEKKANHRKLRQQKGEIDLRKKLLAANLPEVGSFSNLTDSCEENGALGPADNSVPFEYSAAMRSKITYQLKGYIVEDQAVIVAESSAPNEVYVACVDSVVQVVAPSEETSDAAMTLLPKGVSRTTNGIWDIPLTEEPRAAQKTDNNPYLFTFYPVESALCSPGRVLYTLQVNRGDILSFAPTHEEGREGASSSSSACGVRGTWRVDPGIFTECILLSLVRDECKRAREASPEDPNWVRDPITQRPVHQDSFYIWRFSRGPEVFFYGTVPKFANPKQSGRGAGWTGLETSSLREEDSHSHLTLATIAGEGRREAEGRRARGSPSSQPSSRYVPPRYGELVSTATYQAPPAALLYEANPPPPPPPPITATAVVAAQDSNVERESRVNLPVAAAFPPRGASSFSILPVSSSLYDHSRGFPLPPFPASATMQYQLLEMPAYGPQSILYSTSSSTTLQAINATNVNSIANTSIASSLPCMTTSKLYSEAAGLPEGYSTPAYYCLAPPMPPYFAPSAAPSMGMTTSGVASCAMGAYRTFLPHELPMRVIMLQPPSQ